MNVPHNIQVYLVIKEENLEALVKEVNTKVKEGYMPCGSICVVPNLGLNTLLYFQSIWNPGIFGPALLHKMQDNG